MTGKRNFGPFGILKIILLVAVLLGLWCMVVGASEVLAATGANAKANGGAKSDRVITFAIMNEPPQLDSTKSSDQESSFVLGHILEGLTRDSQVPGEYQPGIAEKWELGEHGAVFHLRHDAVWADGKPVTAKDFVFSWRKVVDPKNASEYAMLMYPLKNAEAINSGKAPVESLGVEAVDDYTLKVTYEKVCGYILGLTAHTIFLPIREDFYNAAGGKYGADAKYLLSDGPFVLEKWDHAASLRFVKNPRYWNKSAIKIDRIEIPYITADNTAQFNFFKDRKSELVERLSKDDLPNAMAQNFNMKAFNEGSLWYLTFNFREGRATRNLHLRKAIQLAYDASEFIPKVVGIPGTRTATRLIPSWLKGVKKMFQQEYPYNAPKPNLEAARKELELAKQELGGTIPPLTWLTSDTNFAAREAEYFQGLLKQKLGLDVRLDKQTFKQRLAKSLAGDFDICSEGWGPDYVDPMTFSDLFTSWNENNRGKFSNPEYDRWVRAAQASGDPKERMQDMANAERVGLEQVAVLPTYERVIIYMVSPKIKGVVRNPIGADPDFYFAWVTQ